LSPYTKTDGIFYLYFKSLKILYLKSDIFILQIPAMDRRVITPYQEGPDISHLEVEDGDVFLKEEINMEQSCL
jgi:hypothetical protein